MPADEKQPARLREQAAMARRWSAFVTDGSLSGRLSQIAEQLDDEAEKLDTNARALRVNAEITRQSVAELSTKGEETRQTVTRAREARTQRIERRRAREG
jgi:hypothetical protein